MDSRPDRRSTDGHYPIPSSVTAHGELVIAFYQNLLVLAGEERVNLLRYRCSAPRIGYPHRALGKT